ncbi:MAG: PTS glucitol/sorbitol transporter subunit IIA [Eubacteriaceae bacterium]|jgi:PTS system glucitol/sorbitol-specific IIA component|nr:PTS glucitol/sorbitol transporter subunit IIA [Eubacteriaceae bacterium]
MDFKSVVTGIGPLVEEMAEAAGLIIVFDDNAPESLAEMAVLHTHCDLSQDVKVGDVVLFGNYQYVVTAVGEEANKTLKSMGHCSFKFTGEDSVDMPGQIALKGDGVPAIKVGDSFEIIFV